MRVEIPHLTVLEDQWHPSTLTVVNLLAELQTDKAYVFSFSSLTLNYPPRARGIKGAGAFSDTTLQCSFTTLSRSPDSVCSGLRG